MSQAYYWRTREDAALLVIALGLFGVVQIILSYVMAMVYWIISPVVLSLVPFGVILAQGATVAVLANFLAVRVFPRRVQRGVPQPTPVRQYSRRFAISLLAIALVLGIWGGIFALIWFFSAWTQIAYLVGYLIANTAGALTALSLVALIDWLFLR
jgi:hypothetical protein